MDGENDTTGKRGIWVSVELELIMWSTLHGNVYRGINMGLDRRQGLIICLTRDHFKIIIIKRLR